MHQDYADQRTLLKELDMSLTPYVNTIILNSTFKLSEGKQKQMGTESEQQTQRGRDREGGVAREVVISLGKLGSRLV